MGDRLVSRLKPRQVQAVGALLREPTLVPGTVTRPCWRPSATCSVTMRSAVWRFRIEHAPAVLGPTSVRGLLDPEPCWREVPLELNGPD